MVEAETRQASPDGSPRQNARLDEARPDDARRRAWMRAAQAGDQAAYGAEATNRLGEAVADLPARQREAVQLLVLQERSLAETAATTGRSKGSLKVNLHRALKSLRARLGPVG